MQVVCEKPVENYHYLWFKNWDKNVLPVGDSYAATDHLNTDAYKLSDLVPENFPEKFGDIQKDPAKAKAMVDDALYILPKDEFEAQVEAITQQSTKKVSKRFIQRLKLFQRLETTMQLGKSVTHIAWVPLSASDPTGRDRSGKLKGHYSLKVKTTKKIAKDAALKDAW